MTRQEIINEYMQWLQTLVYDKHYSRRSYNKLFDLLYSRNFTYTIELDGNRAEDGIELRYKFGFENGLHDAMITDALDCRECSVLEMMVALAQRCEVHIMGDPGGDDNTGYWFWNMIENLGLDKMYDENFDLGYVEDVLDQFLNREYEPDGKGGLFRVKNCRRDMRSVEIWYQLCWYLDEVLSAS